MPTLFFTNEGVCVPIRKSFKNNTQIKGNENKAGNKLTEIPFFLPMD